MNLKSHAPKLYVSEPRGQGRGVMCAVRCPCLVSTFTLACGTKSGASTAGQVPGSRSNSETARDSQSRTQTPHSLFLLLLCSVHVNR